MIPKTTLNGKSIQAAIGVGGLRISERAKELVLQVLNSNRLSAGPVMERFEKEIARIHGCFYGLMCNSGTSALQIALAALKETDGWNDGDEVLVPAITFIATSNVVLYNNLHPVFVDVEREHYCIDPTKIEEKITSRTRAIIPVHIGGFSVQHGSNSEEIALKHKLRIVEDSAEAMFSLYKGRPVGSFSDIGCFSTYVAHMLSTGVGGLCVTNDADLFVILKSLMNHGRDSIYTRIDDDLGVEGPRLFEIAKSRFSFSRLGHSFRATEMEAALGLAELEDHESNCDRRREVTAKLTEGLSPFREYLQLPKDRPDTDHALMFYPMVLTKPEYKRDDLIRHLEEHSIETRYLLPLINQPIYRKLFGDLDKDYPVASWLNERAFYIGCHPEMSDEDLEYILECFHEFFRGRRG